MDIYLSADEGYLLVFLIYVYGRWRVLLFIKDMEGHIKESMWGVIADKVEWGIRADDGYGG